MNLLDKLTILSDAAKYDAACTSSGARRGYQEGKIGCTSTSVAGCCHTFSSDGRCVTLLKVLLSNDCCYNCKYCVNRCTNDTSRATFTPEELAELTIEFYRRNYIEGLFLSSGVLRSPDYTTELMIRALSILRSEDRFNGYIHAKAIPGAAPELVELAEAEALRVLHHHQIGVGHIHAHLDHGGGHQNVRFPGGEGGHDGVLLPGLHLAVDEGHLQVREDLRLQLLGVFRHGLPLVGQLVILTDHGADDVHLPPGLHLLADKGVQPGVIGGGDGIGFNRLPSRWELVDDGHIQIAVQNQGQRPGDGRGGHD